MKRVVDRGQRTRQPGGRAQFFEGQVGLFVQQHPQVGMMAGNNQRLAPGVMVTWSDVAGAFPLLEELLDHAQRHPKAVGDLSPVALLMIVGRQNPFAQIQ